MEALSFTIYKHYEPVMFALQAYFSVFVLFFAMTAKMQGEP